MLLEVIGTPGIGKTTSEGLIQAELSRRGFKVIGIDQLISRTVRRSPFGRVAAIGASAALANRLLGLRVSLRRMARLLRRAMPLRLGSGRPAVVMRMLLLAEVLEREFLALARAEPALAFVNTSGVLQMTASLRVWAPGSGQDEASAYLPALAPGDMAVLDLRAPTATVRERILARGVPAGWPAAAGSPAQLDKTLARFTEALARSADAARALGAVVAECDVAQSIDALPASIAAALDQAGCARP